MDVSIIVVVFVQEMMSKSGARTAASSRVTQWDAPSSTLAAQTSPVHLQALLAPLELASASGLAVELASFYRVWSFLPPGRQGLAAQ